MSEIKVGDLVRVARGMACCGALTGAEGKIFVVKEIGWIDPGKCSACGFIETVPAASGCPNTLPIDLPRLEKIPPLSELDTTDEPAHYGEEVRV